MYVTLGETVRTGTKGRVHCYPYISEDPVGPTRTDKQTRDYAKKAHLEGSPVCVYCLEMSENGVFAIGSSCEAILIMCIFVCACKSCAAIVILQIGRCVALVHLNACTHEICEANMHMCAFFSIIGIWGEGTISTCHSSQV